MIQTPTLAQVADDMTRGGRRDQRGEPERRCIATGESGPTDRLIRFVLSPEGETVPDLAGKLPGRGVWLTADRTLVERAVKKRMFARGFKAQARTPADLADRLEAMLAGRMVALIGLARKAGQAVTGAEKVRARITSGAAGLLVQARDGAPAGRRKMAALAQGAGAGGRAGGRTRGQIGLVELLDSSELGLAFGRDFAIHAALDAGGFAARLEAEARRLSGFRDAPPAGAATGATADARTGAGDGHHAAEGADAENAGHDPDDDHMNGRKGQTGPAKQDDL